MSFLSSLSFQLTAQFSVKECLLSVLILLLSLKYFKNRYSGKVENDVYKGYREIPRPPSVPIVGVPWRVLWKLWDGEIMSLAREVTKLYGPCFRLNFFHFNWVVLNSPEYVQALLASNDYGHFAKADLECFVWPEGLESIIIYTGEEWRVRRKMLSRSFTYKSMRKYYETFNKHANKFVHEMDKLFCDGEAHHIAKNIRTCVFRQTCETVIGLDISELEDGERQSEIFVENLEAILGITWSRVYKPWLLIPSVFNFFEGKRYNEIKEKMAQTVNKIIDKYKEKMKQETLNIEADVPSEENDCVIETMLGNGVDDEKIFHEVSALLAVANDTTSVAAEQLLFLLAIYPEHQRKCQEEVDKVFEDHDGMLDAEAVKELKYVERCVLEEQRMYPLTALLMRKLDAPLKLKEGLIIPAGTNAGVIGHVLHYDPVSFPDPDKFDPDRFLPEQIRKRHPFAYTPFSAGPRVCLGMKLAITELKIFIARVLRTFDVYTTDKREDMKLVNDVGSTRFHKPVDFIFRRREI